MQLRSATTDVKIMEMIKFLLDHATAITYEITIDKDTQRMTLQVEGIKFVENAR